VETWSIAYTFIDLSVFGLLHDGIMRTLGGGHCIWNKRKHWFASWQC